MVAAHLAAAVAGFVQGLKDVDAVAGVGAVVVPLVGPRPGVVQVRGRRVGVVLGGEAGLLDRRVALEPRPDQVLVLRPVVLGVGGRVDADEAAAPVDVFLQGALLGVVQDVAGGGEEDDGLVVGEVLRGEGGHVLGGGDGEVVLRAELLEGGDARRDGVVAESGGLGEDQDLVGIGGCRALHAGAQEGGPEGESDGAGEPGAGTATGTGTRTRTGSSHRSLTCAPWVVKVKASRSKRLPWPVGPVKTKNNSVDPAGALFTSAVTST